MNRIMYFFVLCTLVLSLSVFGQESSTTPAVRQIEQPPPQFSFKDVASIAIPQRMTYQGVLTGPGGAPVTDGAYNITIELFDVSSGSAAVWTDNTFTLPVERGAFTVILGSSVPLNIVFDKTYWLQVTVTGGPALPPPATYPETLLPRTELTATPYSLAPWSPAARDRKSVV